VSFSTIKKTVPAADGQGSIDRYPLAPVNPDAAARRRSYLATTALTAALWSILAGGIRPATAANFTWDGTGATTTTNNYNLDTNWGACDGPDHSRPGRDLRQHRQYVGQCELRSDRTGFLDL
jgi:hypothetical protein